MIKAFAQVHGCTERNARIHRSQESVAWREFTTEYGGAEFAGMAAGMRSSAESEKASSLAKGETTSAATTSSESDGDGMPAELVCARRMEVAAWANWVDVQSSLKLAKTGNKPEIVASWIRAENEAAQSYRKARADRERVEVKDGQLVRASEIGRIEAELLQPLKDLLDGMPHELGPRANPMMPRIGIEECQRWRKERLVPLLLRVRAAIPGARPGPLDAAPGNAQTLVGSSPQGGKGEGGELELIVSNSQINGLGEGGGVG